MGNALQGLSQGYLVPKQEPCRYWLWDNIVDTSWCCHFHYGNKMSWVYKSNYCLHIRVLTSQWRRNLTYREIGNGETKNLMSVLVQVQAASSSRNKRNGKLFPKSSTWEVDPTQKNFRDSLGLRNTFPVMKWDKPETPAGWQLTWTFYSILCWKAVLYNNWWNWVPFYYEKKMRLEYSEIQNTNLAY